MRTSLFILVVLGLGFLLTIYFERRRKNFDQKHPGQENPIQSWFSGKGKDKDDPGK